MHIASTTVHHMSLPFPHFGACSSLAAIRLSMLSPQPDNDALGAKLQPEVRSTEADDTLNVVQERLGRCVAYEDR